MTNKAYRFRLFEVTAGGRVLDQESAENTACSIQATLFPDSEDRSLIFVSLPGVSEQDFVSVLAHTKPAYVVDLRPVPRFDIGQLNRHEVFTLFRQEQTTYIDHGEAGLGRSPHWLGPAGALFKEGGRGPVMFLVSGAQNGQRLREAILKELDCTGGAWQVYDVPPSSSTRIELCCATS